VASLGSIVAALYRGDDADLEDDAGNPMENSMQNSTVMGQASSSK
jgi:hypothetical protein